MFSLITYNARRGKASLYIEPKSKENTNNCLTLRPYVDRKLRLKGFHFSQGIISKLKTQCTPIVLITIPLFLSRDKWFPCPCNGCLQDRRRRFLVRQNVYWKRSVTLMNIISGFYLFYFILIAYSVFNRSQFDILWMCEWYSIAIAKAISTLP